MQNNPSRPFPIRAYYKSKLALAYGMDWRTINQHLLLEGIIIPKDQRILTPVQVRIIMDCLGKPDL